MKLSMFDSTIRESALVTAGNEQPSESQPNGLFGFFSGGTHRQFARKDTILASTDDSDDVFYILSGSVKVAHFSNSGDEHIEFIFRQRELFCIRKLFMGRSFDADYIAMTDCTLAVKPKREVDRFFREHPQSLRIIVAQLITMADRIETFNTPSADHRVIHQLLALGARFGTMADGAVEINLPLTQQELAANVMLSRETTGKVLKRLEDEDAVLVGRRKIRIIPQKLSELLEVGRRA